MEKFWPYFLISLAIFGIAAATYSDCGSDFGVVESLEVSSCQNDEAKCVLKRGGDVSIKITFKPKENVEKLTAVVHGVILEVPIPFSLPNSDGCVSCGNQCPLKADQTYVYETDLPILKKYPRVTVDVKWELKDQDNKNVICILIPSKIQ